MPQKKKVAILGKKVEIQIGSVIQHLRLRRVKFGAATYGTANLLVLVDEALVRERSQGGGWGGGVKNEWNTPGENIYP